MLRCNKGGTPDTAGNDRHPMTDQTTPPEVAAAASRPVSLSLSDLTLIGTFTGPEGGRALIRNPGGEIVQVTVGDETPAGTVVVVAETHLLLVRGTESIVLPLPDAG